MRLHKKTAAQLLLKNAGSISSIGPRVMRDLMPHRYPRLNSVQVKTDFDLSKLSDAELVFLRRALLKAQGN